MLSPKDVYYAIERYQRSFFHFGIKGQKKGVRRGPPYPLQDWQKYDIIDQETNERFHLSKGTRIKNPETFAGKGTSHPLHDNVKEGLSNHYGGEPQNWKHCKGTGIIDFYGEDREAEVHWFQEESAGKHGFKIKHWLED